MSSTDFRGEQYIDGSFLSVLRMCIRYVCSGSKKLRKKIINIEGLFYIDLGFFIQIITSVFFFLKIGFQN